MDPLMHFDLLLNITAGAGLALDEDVGFDDANLYCLVDQQGRSVYIGQAASGKRHRDEARFSETLDHTLATVSGDVALRNENAGEHRPLRYNPATFKFTA